MQRTISSIHPGTIIADLSTIQYDIKDILDLHTEKLSKGENFQNSLTEIVGTLGGIDNVIQTCLRSKEASFPQHQLQRLQQILETPQSDLKPSITFT